MIIREDQGLSDQGPIGPMDLKAGLERPAPIPRFIASTERIENELFEENSEKLLRTCLLERTYKTKNVPMDRGLPANIMFKCV